MALHSFQIEENTKFIYHHKMWYNSTCSPQRRGSKRRQWPHDSERVHCDSKVFRECFHVTNTVPQHQQNLVMWHTQLDRNGNTTTTFYQLGNPGLTKLESAQGRSTSKLLSQNLNPRNLRQDPNLLRKLKSRAHRNSTKHGWLFIKIPNPKYYLLKDQFLLASIINYWIKCLWNFI